MKTVYRRLPPGIYDSPANINVPPVETVFFEFLESSVAPDRFSKFLFFGPEIGQIRPLNGKKKRTPSIYDARLYRELCAWKLWYEAEYGISSGLKGWVQRNFYTLVSAGLLTAVVNVLIALVKTA